MNATYNPVVGMSYIQIGATITYYCRDCGTLIQTIDHNTPLFFSEPPDSMSCSDCQREFVAKRHAEVVAMNIPDPMADPAAYIFGLKN